MLIDLYRLIRIVLKFVFYDLWIGIYNVFIGKQNDRIKETYHRRVAMKSKKRT